MAGSTLLPVYFVIDVSDSMGPYLPTLKRELVRLLRSTQVDPIIEAFTRIAIIAFADEAEIVMPLSRTSEALPRDFASRGGTRYGPAIELLHTSIRSDLDSLRLSGFRIYRPLAFFITDGEPTDLDWVSALDRLTREAYVPTIIALGIGDVSPSTVLTLAGASGRAFLVSRAVSLNMALDVVFEGVAQTLVSSTTNSVDRKAPHPIPIPEGWIALAGAE